MICTAKTSAGAPCKKSAIRGGSVCATHGGSAPQVKRKAAERLAEARDDALALLTRQIQEGNLDPKVALAAVVQLTEAHALLTGQATERTEHTITDTREAVFSGLDELASRRDRAS